MCISHMTSPFSPLQGITIAFSCLVILYVFRSSRNQGSTLQINLEVRIYILIFIDSDFFYFLLSCNSISTSLLHMNVREPVVSQYFKFQSSFLISICWSFLGVLDFVTSQTRYPSIPPLNKNLIRPKPLRTSTLFQPRHSPHAKL